MIKNNEVYVLLTQQKNIVRAVYTSERNLHKAVDYWMKEAEKSNVKYGITRKLGISDEIENYICVGFLGVRLMRQSERRMRDLISESDFFRTRIDKEIYDEVLDRLLYLIKGYQYMFWRI